MVLIISNVLNKYFNRSLYVYVSYIEIMNCFIKKYVDYRKSLE